MPLNCQLITKLDKRFILNIKLKLADQNKIINLRDPIENNYKLKLKYNLDKNEFINKKKKIKMNSHSLP